MDPILLTIQLLGFLLNMGFAGMFMYGYLQGNCKGWVAACWAPMFIVFASVFLWGLLDNLTQAG